MDKQIKPMNNWQFINTIILSILIGFQWEMGQEGFVIGIIMFFIVLIGYMIKNK